MRNALTIVIGLAASAFLISDASALTRLKAEQVRTVCGKKLKETSQAMGCETACGKKTCTFNCAKDKKGNAHDCSGDVLRTGTAGKPSSTGAGVGR